MNSELALARRNNELTGRFTKRMTRLALGVAALCLLVSITSLVVAAQQAVDQGGLAVVHVGDYGDIAQRNRHGESFPVQRG